jgi:anaerobic dimethyl sulfoxide reductase subunit C (anchor subunit)/Tat-targeted selenate reductase subunit YnfH
MGIIEHALSELPLALFSTFAPLGAGAFVLLALAFFTKDFDARQLRRIDVLTVLPLLFVVGGFVAAFFHLQTPMNAFAVFGGIGRSPLSNEILCGVIFLVLAGFYWLVALTGKLPLELRRVWSLLAALAAVLFVIFIGTAYAVSTIPSWDTAWTPLALVGFCLLGGGALGLLVLRSAGPGNSDSEDGGSSSSSDGDDSSSSEDGGNSGDGDSNNKGVHFFRNAAIALTVAGALMALAGVSGQLLFTNTLSGIMVHGSAIVSEVVPWFAVFTIGIVVVCGLVIWAIFKTPPRGALVGAVIIVTATVFVGRMMFYALQVPVGL